MIKVSVVIPVYNAQNFIRQCLDSILGQTFSEFEIICVDDGSTDNSYEILTEYASRNDNITVVKQENAGQGVARNRGVSLARGEYVAFVDADDYLHEGNLRILYQTAKETKADITVCKAFCVDATGTQITPLKMWNHLSGKCSKSDIADMDFFNNACSPVLWDKLIKSDIAKRFLSPPLRRGQDFVTLIQYLSACESIFFIKDRLYYYRHHKASVMAVPESRDTIMSDFTTEQMATTLISKLFSNTQSYMFYCQRITDEWSRRLQHHHSLLRDEDITAIKRFLANLP